MVVDYLSSQPNRAGYQVSTKQGSGPSVRSAAGELGCHYGHALNFCHAFGLPVVYKAKRVDRRGSQAFQLVELVRSGLSVHQAAKRCGMHLTAAYAVATEAGCHIRLSEGVRLFVCGGWFTSSPRIGRGKPRLVG